MYLLMFLLGIVLVGAGFVFALKGTGSEDAGAGAKVISVRGPAWLIVIGLGSGLSSGSVWLSLEKPSPVEWKEIPSTVRPSLHAALDALHSRCGDGEMLACDEFGMSCGGRTNMVVYRKDTGTCVQQLGFTG